MLGTATPTCDGGFSPLPMAARVRETPPMALDRRTVNFAGAQPHAPMASADADPSAPAARSTGADPSAPAASTGADQRAPVTRPRTRPELTWLAVAGTVVVTVAFASMLWRGRSAEVIYARWMFHNGPLAVLMLWLGRTLLVRQPGHGLARAFLLAGSAMAGHVAMITLADARLVAHGVAEGTSILLAPADLPLATTIPLWISAWLWVPPAASTGTFLLLLFPDGRLPSRRWRPLSWVTPADPAPMTSAYVIAAWPGSTEVVDLAGQPLDAPIPGALGLIGGSLLLVAACGSIWSLWARWRSASTDVRRQLRAVLVAGGFLAGAMTFLFPWQALWVPGVGIAIAGFVTAYAVAVLRFRLHDLDVAINRTVVGSLLAVAVTAVYIVVVVGLGSLVGRNATNPLLPLLAVGLIAVLFEPARRRVRRLVDRLLYGRDADAYEVLSELSAQLRDTGSLDAVADRVTALLVRGTGAAGAAITMQLGERPRVLATDGLTEGPPARTAVIVHDGEVLGDVALYARSGSDLAPDAPLLLQNVASTLGAVLRNAALTAELQDRVEALRRSRERLVTAQDEARRALERDLHDGAQAQLVALRLQLGLVAQRTEQLTDPLDEDSAAGLHETILGLGADTDAAIRMLRDLSRGLQPAVLTTEGVPAALRAVARRLPTEVAIADTGIGRHPPQIEAAIYLCCLEALRNAATHARADHIDIALSNGDGRLRFTVADDGNGFDPARITPGTGLTNLEDRIAALGGSVTVDSAPGRGTRVVGELPVQPLVADR
jgi:two-component system, NarL family, sensor kinase